MKTRKPKSTEAPPDLLQWSGNMIALIGDTRPEELGLLPDMIDQDDPRGAVEQFDSQYGHGGGWRPMQGMTNVGIVLHYPGDPPFYPIASWPLRGELIVVYRYGIVAVFDIASGKCEVARMD